jgi:hypothetical protein
MRIETYLPLFSGFYGSHWDEVDFYGEDEIYNIPEDRCFDDFVDWDKYHQAIAEEYCYYVEEELSDFINGIEFQKLVSPKYYNFSNDSINCAIDIDVDKVNEYLKDNALQFAKYLKERYTSCDGFISSYSTDVNDWWYWAEDKHMAGSILQFICENEGIKEPDYFENLYISEFYTEEINEYYIEDL